MLCSTHTVQSTFPAKLLPDPDQLRISVRQYVRLPVCLSVCQSVCLLVCLSVSLSVCQSVWQLANAIATASELGLEMFTSHSTRKLFSIYTHSTGPFKSDPCANWAALISASYSFSSSVSYPQQLFVSVHLMHNFRLQLNKTRTKRVTSVASCHGNPFFAFSPILCFYSTRIKLQNVLASKKK